MGCFLACFGFSKKRKRRKPANKIISGDKGHGSYKPLDSDLTLQLDITEKPNNNSDSEFSGKDGLSVRIKKKVSFNLNVKTYEPLPNCDFTSYFSESDDEKCEENQQEKALKSSYPSDYRYRNCRESSDEEEDDIKLEESDPENESDEEHDDDCDSINGDDGRIVQEEEVSEKFCSLSRESEQKNPGVNHMAPRDRSQYVFSVLKPIENLNQWKAVKARARKTEHTIKQQQQQQQRKENKKALEQEEEQEKLPLCRKYPNANPSSPFSYEPNSDRPRPPMQEDPAVDTSLSNWLVS
ncbi:Phosphatase and actin regulator like [Actinidia chinensis var. chinensis]|uniref:Phosphatase and actin regulator like n=1 Tax=Actinidia chinensis var. chinensis TaxID=1590841 RepID=A0A2R6R8Q1_ACTCC|nr:Phosphatase and actin regulator like [Actinidia chinensis var. chinensis]